jgi:8-oxo-dGTP pyrophosphatase MutT (NUDIX family)
VIQRADNGKWQIPGGILELHESIPAGLRREVLEETGVEIDAGRLTGVYKNVNLGVVALVFRATVVGGRPTPTAEAVAVEWWTPARIEAETDEVFAIRVLDALDSHDTAVRLHDGVNLLPDDHPAATP